MADRSMDAYKELRESKESYRPINLMVGPLTVLY